MDICALGMKKILIFAILSLCAPLADAETIYLKNGKVIEGKITERRSNLIKIDTGLGLSVPYYRDEIERILGLEEENAVLVPEPQPEVVLRIQKVEGRPGIYWQIFSVGNEVVAQKKIAVEPVADNTRLRTLVTEGNIPDGVVRMYDRPGQIIAEFSYRYNKEDGLAKLYYPDGHVKAEMTYVSGRKTGFGKMFYESGALMGDVDFGNEGIEDPIDERGYYEDGKLKYEINRSKKILNLYDLNGKLLVEKMKEKYAKHFLEKSWNMSFYETANGTR